jgi:hypothetical protein
MMRLKRVVAVLGLCAALLALVVFGTSASQAEKGANWMVNGTNVSATLLPVVQIKEVENKMMALVGATKSGTKVEVACTGAQFLNAKLGAEGTVSSGNVTNFTGCVTKLNGVVTASCSPKTPGQPKGTVVSEPLVGLMVLHEGKTLVKFTPVTGTTFVKFEFGEECSLGEVVPVTGTSTVEDGNGEFGVELVAHLVRQGPLSSLTFCGTPAVVVGSAMLSLAGAHEGLKWSALPA